MRVPALFTIRRMLFVWAVLSVFTIAFLLDGSAHAGGASSPALQASGVCGDLNGDEIVDIFDAVIEAKISAGVIEPVPPQDELGNVVIDSVINLADLTLLVKHIIGLTTITGCGLTNIFEINIGDVVSEGVPEPGAGSIEFAGSADVYTFQGTAGQPVYFDTKGTSNLLIRWMAEDPNGGLVFSDRSMATTDPGLIVLPLTGTYTITVFGINGGTGTYQFQTIEVARTQEFQISIGDVVSDGVPEPGAGNIEAQGSTDIYTFEGTAGQVVYFDSQERSNNQLQWRSEDPNGGVVFANRSLATTDPGVIELPTTGTYVITVFGEGSAIGTYQFQVIEVPIAQEFVINIGDVVPDDVIGNGAGVIESQGSVDIYTFEGEAGRVVYFDSQERSDNRIQWRAEDPDGGVVFANRSMATIDPEITALPLSGEYKITVFGVGGITGTYQFQVLDVPPAQEFTINIGDVVPDDLVDNGAGNLESQGALDIYRFEGTAGQQVFFEQLSTTNPSIRWKGEDPNGGVLFAEQSMATTDVGMRTLPFNGTYVITVSGNQGATGTYRFQTYIGEP